MKFIVLNLHQSVKIQIRTVFIIIIILFTSGCITSTKLVKPSDTNSVVEFTKNLQYDTSSGLTPIFVISNRDLKNYRDYVTFKASWCPRHKKVYGPEAVKLQYRNYCRDKGGRYLEPFCVSYADNGIPLFYAKVTTSNMCGKYPFTVVNIIEPTGKIYSKNYMRALKWVGFRTSKDKQNSRANAVMQKLRETLRLKRDLPKMQNVGTKICKDERRYTHVGYVERVAAEKIQIRVANIHFKGRPDLHPGGFSPSIIWDYPSNWYVCE